MREILVRDGQTGARRRAAARRRRRAQRRRAEPAAGPARAERIRRRARRPRPRSSRASPRPPISRTAEAAEHLARERALFAARRRTLDEHIASLHAQIREAQAQVDGARDADRGDRDVRPALRRGAGDQREARAAGLRPAHAPAGAAARRGGLPRAAWASTAATWRSRASASASWRRASRRRATSTSSRPPTS